MTSTTPSGQQIGRYHLIGELGRGGMGIVYRARDPVIDREVALKTIRNSEGLDPRVYTELRDRFLNEARAAGRLQHPNIVAILDAGTDDTSGVSYIAMELIRGRDLDSFLSQGQRFEPAEAARIVAAVAKALGYAHQNGVVHRDVKPANVLIDDAGGVKITDFGIARLAESSMTRTGQILGSPAFMSPEQIAGGSVDARSDIFSLGVVLYQLLTGEKPFQGEGLSTLSFQIVNTEPVPVRKVNPGIPAAYEAVVERAMRKSPEDRFATAADMAQALAPGVAPTGLATSVGGTIIGDGGRTVDLPKAGARPASNTIVVQPASREVSPSQRRRRPKRQPWLLPIVAGLSALAGTVVAVVLLRGGSESNPATSAAVGTIATPLVSPTTTPQSTVAEDVPQTPVTVAEPDPATEAPVEGETPPVADGGINEIPYDLPDEPESGDGKVAAVTAATARLHIDFEHHIEHGTVVLELDGREMWRKDLRASKKPRFGVPGLKLAHGEINEQIDVPAGEHVLLVRVESKRSGVDDTNTIRTKLKAGRTSLLRIRVDRITRKLTVARR